ncbi:MAG: metallophosphoesterase [Candidatus Diapherotrites archaeon]
MELEERKKEILGFAEENNLVLDSKAMELLAGRPIEYKGLLKELAEGNAFIISKGMLEEKIKERFGLEEKKKKTSCNARELQPDIRLIEELNVTSNSVSEGKVKDFIAYFQDKFLSLSEMLSKRPNFNPRPIKRLRTTTRNNEIELIAMVREKWKTKAGNIAFRIEDLEAECVAVISKDNLQLNKVAETILCDNVIGIKAIKASEGMIIVKELFQPELPLRTFKKAEREVNLIAISDLHVGSKLFLEHSFYKFLEWLNCQNIPEKEIEAVKKIKYLLILGDISDGIGVYPEQINELNIRNIYDQYKRFEQLMMEVPEHIEVIMIPGQHDAVRFADPQPAIPEEFLPELYEKKNFHFLSSPGWAEIEGLKCLLYHGPSLHDLYSSVSFLSYSRPHEAMIELLKKRDLMPCYGMKRPYVPEKKDYMAIKELPDLFFEGDLHHNSYGEYRGTIVVSCGTWQKRTEFQVKQGHVPTPGIAVMLELNTGKIIEKSFYSEAAGEGTIAEEIELGEEEIESEEEKE